MPLHQPEQQFVHAKSRQRVERAERFVGQQQSWLSDQGPGQGSTLLLATRQQIRPGVLSGGNRLTRPGA